MQFILGAQVFRQSTREETRLIEGVQAGNMGCTRLECVHIVLQPGREWQARKLREVIGAQWRAEALLAQQAEIGP